MSFLLNALGAAGTSLLGSAGGWLLGKAKPIVSKISSYFTNAFGGDNKNGLGRTVMDRLYSDGVNAAFGGLQKFAQSKMLENKVPIMVPYMQNSADAFKDRMGAVYNHMMSGPQTGPGPMQGIERQR